MPQLCSEQSVWFRLRPDHRGPPPTHSFIRKTHGRNMQTPGRWKGHRLTTAPGAAEAGKRPSCPRNRYCRTKPRLYLSVPLSDRPQRFFRWFSFTYSIFTATLIRRSERMNRKWVLVALDRFIWTLDCFPFNRSRWMINKAVTECVHTDTEGKPSET